MEDYRREAEHFLTRETQFHLGVLPTEQPHPKTVGLAETLQEDCAAGVRMLQSVDQDVSEMAHRVLGGPEATRLSRALAEAVTGGRRVCFSGCGATGRLSILLEAMWRCFWRDFADRWPDHAATARSMADRITSIMTGGDYALIRSVENFEDYISFGREQVREAGLGEGDVLVAISEGGETSSVIGTLLEALDRGVEAFFVFNNPAEILAEHVERSARVIEDPDVTVLDISTGPMALTGSTRMQATTAELLVVGAALETALAQVLPEVLPSAVVEELPEHWLSPAVGAEQFDALLTDLADPGAVETLATWTDLEYELYAEGGLITYFAHECLLDIFTDTTERAPTFMLPPFRKCDDTVSPPSWPFVKDPMYPTPQTWLRVLGREPRCLEWTPETYRRLGAAESIVESPPMLGREELMKFLIGRESDASRTETEPNVAMQVRAVRELRAEHADQWSEAFETASSRFGDQRSVVIGDAADLPAADEQDLLIPCRLPPTALHLWERLGVKLVLNTVSTATMGRLGRLVSNWMANVETSNKKLIDRGTRLVAELTGLDYASACRELHRTIAEIEERARPGDERVSPVAATVERLGRGR
ncbi:MAG: sugar phosphate isomerase [Armatimonadota bacterium]